MDQSVDPQLRLQNIALEAQELLQQRSMAWIETTNRVTMFMTVVGATVFALALVGNAVDFDTSFLLFAAVGIGIALAIGIFTFGRLGELDQLDWRWVQGLNRLRHARLELDPGFAAYLVTSPHDDAEAVLSSYATESASDLLHGLYILPTLVALVNALLAAALLADVALLLGQPAQVALVLGIGAFVAVLGAMIFSGYRAYVGAMRSWTARFPSGQPDRTDRPT